MNKFAGKTASSNAIMPNAPKAVNDRMQSNAPNVISAIPVILLRSVGFGK
jgi:hypothetical protein